MLAHQVGKVPYRLLLRLAVQLGLVLSPLSVGTKKPSRSP